MGSGTAVYFFSDAHLGTESREAEAEQVRRLDAFLASLPGRASHVYIVGDLFDFWFEYRHAIPRRHFHTLAALRRVTAAGVRVTYMTGNHDFWLGSFLTDELGVTTHDGALAVTHQDRRIWLHHGDGLLGGDVGYKILRRVIRHPLSLKLWGLIHPDLGFPAARRVSLASRHSRDARVLDGDRLWREVALPRFAEGHDAILIGHMHQVFERRDGGRAFFVLGDWIRHFSYVVLEDGEFSLRFWPAG